ncbi:MAG: phage virion morphogenesis protein [Saccharofermentanales bacterium]|jgi:phage gpG-like protein
MAVKLNIIMQDKGVTALFRRLQQRLADTQPFMDDIGERVKGSVQRNFDEEGRPQKWVPLRFASKVAWILRKKTFWSKKGYMNKKGKEAWAGRKILNDTARLRRSISHRAFKNRVKVSTLVKYAMFHQEGTRKMPARPFLLVQQEDWDYIIRLGINYLK